MPDHQMLTAVLGLPIRGDGKVLLSQRYNPERPTIHNKWQVIGGGMEFGETPEQTLAREFEEEIKCSVRILSSRPMVRTNVWDTTQSDPPELHHITLIVYLVDIGDQTPDAEADEETGEVGWFTFEEALSLESLPQTKEFLLQAQEIIANEKIVSTL